MYVVRRQLLILTAVVLVACSPASSQPTSTTRTPVPGATLAPPSNLLAANAALAFIDAINKQDYARAFDTLSNSAKGNVKDVSGLRREYLNTHDTATVITATYQLRGGLIVSGSTATAGITGAWQTGLFGPLNVTGTLMLEAENAIWRVKWNRDAMMTGLVSGTLVLDRDDPQRGTIFSADGVALAGQGFSSQLGVVPGKIASPQQENEMLALLNRLTNLPIADIKAKYQKAQPDWFVPIAIVSQERLTRNSDQIGRYAALVAQQIPSRTYADDNIAPHVVGYVGAISAQALPYYQGLGYSGDELVGVTGIEVGMNDELGGRPGGKLEFRPTRGSPRVIARRDKIEGKDVTLTIQAALQTQVQAIIGKTRGAIVVTNPRDGAILAMASGPAYSLNDVTQISGEAGKLLNDPNRPLVNRAVQAYPPGSVFKPVTFAAGFAEDLTRPDEGFVDPGYWDGLGANYRQTCWLSGGHGALNLTEGLSASCNPVFYTLGKRLNEKNPFLLSQYAKQFGFGVRAGLDIGGEAAGLVPDPDWKKAARGEGWVTGDNVNFAIGQGFLLATPVQVAQMTGAIANNGVLFKTRLVSKISEIEGGKPQVIGPPAPSKINISPEVIRAIQQGMIGVTTNTKIGTAENKFRSFDYYYVGDKLFAGPLAVTATGVISTSRAVSATQRAVLPLPAAQRGTARKLVVAGKTGTAQAPGVRDLPFAWFTGYAPADNPQIAVTVMLENIGEGSTFAAPLARQVFEAYFGLPIVDVPPDPKPR